MKIDFFIVLQQLSVVIAFLSIFESRIQISLHLNTT